MNLFRKTMVGDVPAEGERMGEDEGKGVPRRVRRVDGVSHELEAAEGSLCSIFKILYDLLRCSSIRL